MASPLISVPAGPQSPENTVVVVDAWYPEIDCNEARDVLGLGSSVTHARLVAALEGGVITVTGELRAWRARWEAAGVQDLGGVAPDDLMGCTTRLEFLFLRAVRFAAAAELGELHRDLSATNDAKPGDDAERMTAADYRRLSTWAVRDILGVTRTAVELI